MTLRLSVASAAWKKHVRDTVTTLGDVLPVVKGNGYGFGRRGLMSHASDISSDVAVGTVHELVDVPSTMRPFVLTPVGAGVVDASSAGVVDTHGAPMSHAIRPDAVLAVASRHDLDVLKKLNSQNPVVIKVESSMHRYGVLPDDAASLRSAAEAAGHEVVAWSLHLPLAGDGHEEEVVRIATRLSADVPLHVSHLLGDIQRVRASVKQRVVVRTGTQLWLGDKSMLSLHADVISVRRVAAGTVAGYRNTPVSREASLVMVGCGSSHGVGTLDDGRSPFHFARRRLELLEAPHMHTSMLVIGDEPCPREGEWVDVQQPLTRVLVDTVAWR
jgi:alanine racemase